MVNSIPKVVLGTRITDWNKDKKEELLTQLKLIKEGSVKRAKVSVNVSDNLNTVEYQNVEISKIGKLLKTMSKIFLMNSVILFQMKKKLVF